MSTWEPGKYSHILEEKAPLLNFCFLRQTLQSRKFLKATLHHKNIMILPQIENSLQQYGALSVSFLRPFQEKLTCFSISQKKRSCHALVSRPPVLDFWSHCVSAVPLLPNHLAV